VNHVVVIIVNDVVVIIGAGSIGQAGRSG